MASVASPTFGSLFCGCGGFDLGFKEAGFSPVAAFDIEKDAIENFKQNLGQYAYQQDLTQRGPHLELLRGADIITAGPPCQGFSTAGKRNVEDGRNSLLTLTGTLAVELKPKVLVVENVAGALSGDHAKYWKTLTATMASAGYQTETLTCDVTQLGMAQMRKRVILLAWRTGKVSSFLFPNKKTGTVRGVLKGIKGLPNHTPQRLKEGTQDWEIARKIKPGQKLSNVRGGDKAVATWDIPSVFGQVTEKEKTILELLRRLRRQERQRDFGDADPVSISRLEAALGGPFKRILQSLVSKGYVRHIGDTYDLARTFNGKYRRLEWDSPSCTVDTRFGSPRYFLHPEYHRGFTVREAARIQGFPDSYVFSGSDASQYRMIGNAVPPPMAKSIAEMVKRLV